MCLFEHENIKYYTDADLRSLRTNERSPQRQESNDAAYVRSLRIKYSRQELQQQINPLRASIVLSRPNASK